MTVTSPGDRGFRWLEHPPYPTDRNLRDTRPVMQRLASESSALGDYDDAYDRPGSSFLWIGEHHHLNREEVAEFVAHLTVWMSTGRLEEPKEQRT